jgi:hypothetical protein
MSKMTWLDNLAGILALVGALNWGLIGFFNFNLVTSILPSASGLIYKVVGVSAAYFIVRLYMLGFIDLKK